MEKLCQTVAVANRFELSPAARAALADKGGSTNAHIREQIALIDGDPVGTVERTWEQGGTDSPGGSCDSLRRKSQGNSRSQYLALCGVLPKKDKDTLLPLTGVLIASGVSEAESNRPKIASELEAMLDAPEPKRTLQPIVRLLASWVLDMLVNGTPRTPTPAFSTVETYLTRIGGSLVHVFGQSSLSDLDEVELEDAYVAIVEAKQEGSAVAAAAILGFQRHGLAVHALPEVDMGAISVFLGSDDNATADARLVLPAERDAIVAELARRAVGGAGAQLYTLERIRLVRQASAVMPWFAYGGARRSEALGIQHRDVIAEDDSIQIRIRPNSSRKLKTRNARRSVELGTALAGSGSSGTILDWAGASRSRLAAHRAETTFVFAPLEDSRSSVGRGDVAEECLEITRQVTGRDKAKLHSFRHLVAMERTTLVFLSDSDGLALSGTLRLAAVPTRCGGTLLPRDLQAQIIALGQGNPSTTLRWYHHLPWLLRSRADERMRVRHLIRGVMATTLGLTHHALDWAAKNAAGKTRVEALLDIQCQPRRVPVIQSIPAAEMECPPHRWTARDLGDMLTDASRSGSVTKALLVRGASASGIERLREVFLPLEMRLGRRLLEDNEMADILGRPKLTVRRLDCASSIETFWDWFDTDHDGLRAPLAQLAEAAVENMAPGDLDYIRIPASEADCLQDLLARVGIETRGIVRESLGAGLVRIRIPRPEQKKKRVAETAAAPPKAPRFLGLAIKRVLLVIRTSGRGL